MHENTAIREWSVAFDVTVKFLFKSIPSNIVVNIENELCPK